MPTWSVRINLSGFHPSTDHVHGPQHVWVGDQLDLAHQARLDMEHEGHLDRPGVDPGGAELAVDGDRCRPPGAVEAGGHGGCAVVYGIRTHLLSDQVGTHDSVGREEQ